VDRGAGLAQCGSGFSALKPPRPAKFFNRTTTGL
jgi:hypothetical protein